MPSPKPLAFWKVVSSPATGLFLFLVLLNGFLVSPFIGWYDSGEMIGATVCLGISHPCGQALFHLLGKIFLMPSFGTPAFQLGLLSVACSALASVLFFLLCGRLAERFAGGGTKNVSALLKVWLLLLTLAWSLSLPWWKYSLTAEVYTLHLLLGMMILWTVSLEHRFKWHLAFFLMGIATVFRPTQFLAVPFVALFFFMEWKNRSQHEDTRRYSLWHRKESGMAPNPLPSARGGKTRRKAKSLREKLNYAFLKNVLILAAFFALGRSTLLYLPLRSALHPEIAYADLTHPVALLQHLFALQFSSFVGGVSVSSVLAVLSSMFGRSWTDLTPLGIALVVGGVWLLARARKKVPPFLWVALGWGFLEALMVLSIPYPTFEPHQVLLAWAFTGFLAVPALFFLWAWSQKNRRRSILLTLLFAVFALAQFARVGQMLERQKERGAEDYARNLLEIMEPNAFYMPSEENEFFPVVGYQQSFDFEKGVEVIRPGGDPALTASLIRECLTRGRPLYVTRKWALPPGGWRYEEWGPLFRVTSRPPVFEGRPWPPKGRIADWGGVGLAAVILSPTEVRAGGFVELRYGWVRQGPGTADQSQAVVGLFVDAQGNYAVKNGVIWFHDIHALPSGFFSRMKAGLMYEERKILFIPSDFPPGHYRFVVGLQRDAPLRAEGQGTFDREFDERASSQNLDKFLGRGENGALVHFAAITSEGPGEGLWPVTKSVQPLTDPRFAPVAELRILATDGASLPHR